jgi:lysophospholipase L1-like esterase
MMLLVFGDSITYGLNDDKGGWVGRLRKELEKGYLANAGHVENTVYNCGIRGDTTADMLKRFDIELSSRAERQDNPVILFAIGTNDSSTSSGSNSVPMANYKENLSKLLEKAQTMTDKVIFLGLFPADESRTSPVGWNANVSYTNKNLEQYNTIIKEFCKEKGLDFVDIFKPFHNKTYRELLSDGLHPNAKGHQKIYKLVARMLVKKGYLPTSK